MSSALHTSCDAAAARVPRAPAPTLHPNLVLATCVLASSLAFVDGSVVNVGLPAIGRSLSADAGRLPWVVNAYLLPLSALLLIGGAASDRYGRRRFLLAGVALFALASFVCAGAPDLRWLLVGRALQGVGAALLMPASLAILGATFSGEARGRAIGSWAAIGAISGAIGPVLGGWLIDVLSWRAIFLLNLPLAAGAIALAWRFVPPDRDGGDAPLDLAGGALATVSLLLLTWALTESSGPIGWSLPAGFAAAAGLCLAGAFWLTQRRLGDRAMMPLTLFASRTYVGLTVLTLLLYGALGALLVLLPYVLIQAGGYSGTMAGAALLPLPLILAVVSPLAGALAGRIGPRLPLALGPLVVALGFLLAVRIDGSAAYLTQVLPAIVVVAAGLSGAVAPLTTAVLGSVDVRHTGSASGFNSAVARLGGLVATALLGGVLAARGDALVTRFHVAMLVGALACFAAAAGAFFLIRPAAQGAMQDAKDRR